MSPRLTGVTLTPVRLGARGARLSLFSSERASLLLKVTRVGRPGRVVTRARRAVVAGAQRLHLRRRMGGVRLAPGRYFLTLVATDAAGNRSTATVLRLRVQRR
ncbi:hypothetical protein [Nocardioides sp. cx-173]|uniref:hypothetical protein n=1 Tax=Nocardioides sp. cx-173 TaxID=2898796 RepID=UPI001E361545|nr:hypothetical protein [Nocardioides sp. cx-173]MCD4525192.1 hypothetical protein [Nocardioides sp. cx-173]UGB40110.1 hypothetical protein LQ940_11940 [Nocardioides sp. cx-173]